MHFDGARAERQGFGDPGVTETLGGELQDLVFARRKRGVRVLDARGMRILKTLDEVAARHDAVPAQIALAWLMAKPDVTAPIASVTSLAQLDEIMRAPRIKLTREDIAALDASGA